ncbi:MAG: hypothetical protein JXA10_14940, partial [Anaerolineae bacterium]|nr:hypothetical protein [Anaerolineae bacterium]
AMCGTVGGTLMAAYTHRIVQRTGSQVAMVIGMVGAGLSGVIIALTSSLYLASAANFIGGFFWTLAAISQFTYFSENAPADNATRYMTVYNQVVMLAVFIGPMLGSQLASLSLDLVVVLWVGAVLRFVAAGIVAADGLAALRQARRAG